MWWELSQVTTPHSATGGREAELTPTAHSSATKQHLFVKHGKASFPRVGSLVESRQTSPLVPPQLCKGTQLFPLPALHPFYSLSLQNLSWLLSHNPHTKQLLLKFLNLPVLQQDKNLDWTLPSFHSLPATLPFPETKYLWKYVQPPTDCQQSA